MFRQMFRGVVLLLAGMFFLSVWTSCATAAPPERAWITSAGPLSEIGISKRLRCEVRFQTLNWWQSPWGCATAAKVDGTEFGLIGVNDEGEVDEDVVSPTPEYWDGWTPVSQSDVTGTGSRSDPFELVTTVRAADTGVLFTQTDRYVIGDFGYTTSVEVRNTSSQPHQIRLYRSGKCFLDGSEFGYGRLSIESGQVGCMADPVLPTRTIDLVGRTTGASMIEGDGYGWPMTLESPIVTRCGCDTYQKNGLLMAWETVLAAGQSRSFVSITALSQTGQDPIPLSITASDDAPSAGDVVTYTVSAQDSTGRGGRIDDLEVQIPPSAHLVSGSVRTVSLADPAVSGSALTFSNPGAVDPFGSWERSFDLEYDDAGDVSLAASAASTSAVFAAASYNARISGEPRPEEPQLIAPADGDILTDLDVKFSWLPSSRAKNYDLFIDGVRERQVTGTVATVRLTDGRHNWHVVAHNSTGKTSSATRGVTVAGAESAVSEKPYTSLELLRRFRPYLFFQSGEPWLPLDVEQLLGSGKVALCTKYGRSVQVPPHCRQKKAVRSAAELVRLPAGRLEFDPSVRTRSTAMYGHSDKVRGKYRYLDYWWFLANNVVKNQPLYSHHGDWEGLVVAVPNVPRPTGFSFVGFAEHEGVFVYLPKVLRCSDPVSRDSAGTHTDSCGGRLRVNGYPAYGSHATYPRRCTKTMKKVRPSCVQTASSIWEGDFGGKLPWAGNSDESAVRELPSNRSGPDSWAGWPGAWSRFGDDSVVSSPGQQDRYKRPWDVKCTDRWSSPGVNKTYRCSNAWIASVEPPSECARWFGSLVGVVVCDDQALRDAIDSGNLGRSGAVGVVTPDLDVGTAPGLAQGVGAPMSPGDAAVIRGDLTARTWVAARAEVRNEQVVAWFRPGRHGTSDLKLTVSNDPQRPIVMSAGNKTILPVRALTGPAVRPARRVSVRRNGRRILVSFEGRASRATVIASGPQTETVRKTVRLRGRGRHRVQLRIQNRPRTVTVVLTDAKGRASLAVSKRVHW